MNWFWVTLATLTSVIAGSGVCLVLLRHFSDIEISRWWLMRIACPIIRILVLLFIVGLIYPLITLTADSNAIDSLQFWAILFEGSHINQMINILFFGSLFLSFIPILGHPVLALPIQSCLSVAMVFNWQFVEQQGLQISFLPGIGDTLKIVIYLLIAWYLMRELSVWISEKLDRLFIIEGSILLVADAIYLVLQLPVIAIYCLYLKAQLPIAG